MPRGRRVRVPVDGEGAVGREGAGHRADDAERQAARGEPRGRPGEERQHQTDKDGDGKNDGRMRPGQARRQGRLLVASAGIVAAVGAGTIGVSPDRRRDKQHDLLRRGATYPDCRRSTRSDSR